MRLSGDDLATRLTTRRDEALYRRRRQIRQFAHRLRAAVIATGAFLFLLFYVGSLLAARGWNLDVSRLTLPLYGAGWLYIILLPIFFMWRTRLHAYVLYEHWLWLSLWLAASLELLALRFRLGQGQWSIFVFVGLLTISFFVRRWRFDRFVAEMEANDGLWSHLLGLGVMDLAVFGFWDARNAASAGKR